MFFGLLTASSLTDSRPPCEQTLSAANVVRTFSLLSPGSGRYENNTFCRWTIKAEAPDEVVSLVVSLREKSSTKEKRFFYSFNEWIWRRATGYASTTVHCPRAII